MGRRIVQVAAGLLRIEQRLRIQGVEIGTDVAGPVCIYAVVQVNRGAVVYQHGETRVRAPRRFALFLPPFGIVQASLERCDVTSMALAFRPLASDEVPPQPILWAEDGSAPGSRIDAVERIRTASSFTKIGRDRDPGLLVGHAKLIIDREYRAPLEIGRIAARLHMSPAGSVSDIPTQLRYAARALPTSRASHGRAEVVCGRRSACASVPTRRVRWPQPVLQNLPEGDVCTSGIVPSSQVKNRQDVA